MGKIEKNTYLSCNMNIYDTRELQSLKDKLDKLDYSSQRYLLDMQHIVRGHFQDKDEEQIVEMLDEIVESDSELPIKTYLKDLQVTFKK